MPKKRTVLSILCVPCLFLIGTLQSGCYLLTQGSYLLSERLRAESIEKIMDRRKDDVSEDVLLFFSRVKQINDFSESVLHLKQSSNYTTFVTVDKNYLADVVSAAGALSIDPYLWKYPFMGKLPYKGFYNPEGALRESEKLKERGYDTWVRKVSAFSTLGYTSDPLYSFMVNYPIHRIAEMLIHEQVHAAIWLKNNSQFNEEIASFIGEFGTILFLETIFGTDSDELNTYMAEKRDRERWYEDISGLRDELQSLYVSSLPEADKLVEKEHQFAQFKLNFAQQYDNRYETGLYKRVPELELNNAFVALYDVYYEHNELLKRLFTYHNKDIVVMVDYLKTIDRNSDNPYGHITELMGDS